MVTQFTFLAFLYSICSAKAIFNSKSDKFSFKLMFVFTFLVIILLVSKIKHSILDQAYLKTNKTSKQLKVQLIDLVRLSKSSPKDMVENLQKWILHHIKWCPYEDCQCTTFNLGEMKTQQYLLKSDRDRNGLVEQQPLRNISHFTPCQNEFFMGQFFDSEINDPANQIENLREQETRRLNKLQLFILQMLHSEIEECPKVDNQLLLLKISVEIYLKTQGFKVYFKILQLQQNMSKIGVKQKFVIQFLKKHLIDKMMSKDRFKKKESEKVYILNQLKKEQGFQIFMREIQVVSDIADELWKQSANKNYQILTMNSLMDKISLGFMQLWTKFQDQDESVMNPELLMMMARFCDLVLGFELEAESLYMKATTLLNSIKLQQSKGLTIDGEMESRVKGQEFLLCSECSPKQLDKVVFANQKLLHFTEYKMEELTSIKTLMPHVIQSIHDEKIISFLSRQEKTQSLVEIKSWMKVKKGFIVPVYMKSIPHIDIKHDLRFISVLNQLQELEIEDTKLQYQQCLVFLCNDFGAIDSVSKEVYDYLNIHSKLLESGLSLSQLLLGFDCEKLSSFENGSEYRVNRKYLEELLNQLDLGQDQGQPNNSKLDNQTRQNMMLKNFSGSKSNNNTNEFPFQIEDAQYLNWVKVFARQGSRDSDDRKFFEVIAVPIQRDITESLEFQRMNDDQQDRKFHNENFAAKFMNANMNATQSPRNFQKTEEELKNEEDDDQIQHELASLSSATSSQSSKNDSQFQLIRDIKEITQLKSIPMVIQRLRKALHIFFITMLITALVLLIVNIVDKTAFERDINAVDGAFKMQYYISNIRLRFQTLYTWSNKKPPMNQSQIDLYRQDQYQLGKIVEEFRERVNNLTYSIKFVSDSMKELFYINDLQLEILSKSNQISYRNSSFQTSAQEVIQIADQYQYVNETQLRVNRSIFGQKFDVTLPNGYRITDDEQNVFFIQKNLERNIRFKANKIEDVFSQEVYNFGASTEQNILIITMVCISIVAVASVALMPLLFRIDAQLSDSVQTWTHITMQQKEDQSLRIQIFKQILQNQQQPDKKHGKRGQRSRITEIIKKTKQQQQEKEKENKNKPLNKRNKKISESMFEHGIEEEIKEEYDDDYDPQNGKIKSKQRASHQQTPKALERKLSSESDSDFGRNAVRESYAQETEGDRIHKQSQLISLGKYIMTRKLKMGILISLFTACLCSLYTGSYILASNIYDESLKDFSQLATLSSRSPCPSRVLYFMILKYILNVQYLPDQSAGVSFLVDGCHNYEKAMRDMKRNPRNFYLSFKDDLDLIDSDQFCNFYKEKIVQDISKDAANSQQLTEKCLTVYRGILQLGASQAITTIYQMIDQINIFMTAAENLTDAQLQTLIFNQDLQQAVECYSSYLGPTMRYLYEKANQNLYVQMGTAFVNLIIMFVIFLLFLLVTWILSITFLISNLSGTLQRSRISVKLIPASILISIKEFEKGKQLLHSHTKLTGKQRRTLAREKQKNNAVENMKSNEAQQTNKMQTRI